MSTKLFSIAWRRLAFRLGTIALGFSAAVMASAQQMKANLTVLPDSNRVLIDGSRAAATKWSFLDSYGGILGLGRRIEQFALFDANGQPIQVRQIAPGQFESANPATRFRYEVNLTPPAQAAESAMVSWMTKERGVLMSGDLLPLTTSTDSDANSATLRIKSPETWRVVSTEAEKGQDEFDVHDLSRGVFAIGGHLRALQTNESGMLFSMVADGDWTFADREALELAGKILKAHRDVFGAMPAKQGMLVLFPFPQPVGASEWAAETRGSTVTLLMGKLPSKVGALAQLSTPLTHEFFHLWVPNGLALQGDYDWFYEGFTVYQAARTAVQLDLLTFQEFLNSIARAYDASMRRDTLSLLDASSRRFTIGRNSVYAKSQVVAFIYDLRLRSASHRKRSLNDVYRKLFQAYSSAASKTRMSDGNDAGTNALGAEMNSPDFVPAYIRNPVSINLAAELAPFGLKVEMLGLRTHISVNDKLSKQQHDLLRDLGYNEATHATKVVRRPPTAFINTP